MPGSSTVLDRATDTMVQCTAELCPFATPQIFETSYFVDPGLTFGTTTNTTPAQPNAPSSSPAAAPSLFTAYPSVFVSLPSSPPPLVNRAPFSTLADLLADTSDVFLANSTGQKVHSVRPGCTRGCKGGTLLCRWKLGPCCSVNAASRCVACTGWCGNVRLPPGNCP